ncbi:hypothetical protein SETIT_3G133000v2 [Setaria italica]|uniref:Uncharacterized protein n=1 Tax=Setaria italica TaxID=4555 RepID=A0A368QEX9_SETIT|nr:hypothetical protein SETIT_3G133000v2 [Setaria italica]
MTTVVFIFKLRSRRFKFCRGDEFGTRLHGRGAAGAAVRCTPLGRELVLSTELRRITLTCSKVPEMREWGATKQHLPSIRAHAATIRAALERYQARRAARGAFRLELEPVEDCVSFRVISPLYGLPPPAREEARRRCRVQRERRRLKRAAAAGSSVPERPPVMANEL